MRRGSGVRGFITVSSDEEAEASPQAQNPKTALDADLAELRARGSGNPSGRIRRTQCYWTDAEKKLMPELMMRFKDTYGRNI